MTLMPSSPQHSHVATTTTNNNSMLEDADMNTAAAGSGSASDCSSNNMSISMSANVDVNGNGNGNYNASNNPFNRRRTRAASDDISMLSSPSKPPKSVLRPRRPANGGADTRNDATPSSSNIRVASRLFFDYEQVTNITGNGDCSSHGVSLFQQQAHPQQHQNPVTDRRECTSTPRGPAMPTAPSTIGHSNSNRNQNTSKHNRGIPAPPMASPVGVLKPIDLNSALQPHEAADTSATSIGSSSTGTARTGHRHPQHAGRTRGQSQYSSTSSALFHRKRHLTEKNSHDEDDPGLEGRELSFDEEVSLDTSMYSASPRISPITYITSVGVGAGPNNPTKSPTIVLQASASSSPFPPKASSFYPRQQKQQQIPTRSPNSMFRTWDGRTVQSKNPFSPMITEESIAARTTRVAALAPQSSSNDPLSLPVSFSDNAKHTPILRHRFKAPPMTPGSFAMQSPYRGSDNQVGAGRPSKPYSFTGSPIPETTDHSNTASKIPYTQGYLQQPQQKYNSKKVRRLSREGDVASNAAITALPPQDNATSSAPLHWRRLDLQVKTNSPWWGDDESMDVTSTTSNSNSVMNNNKSYQAFRQEEISPTDVLSFPTMPQSPSRIPPATPMKQSRNQFRRSGEMQSSNTNDNPYASIRKSAAPPPTPLPNRNRRRRPDGGTGSLSPVHGESTTPTSTTTLRQMLSGDEDSDGDCNLGGNGSGHGANTKSNDTSRSVSRFNSDFDIIDELGKGSFGVVYKVLSKFDGCLYAIKAAHRPAKGAADKDRMLKEVYALAALSDQADTATFHIVRYHQAWMENQRLYIQTELCTSTLADELKCSNPLYMTEARRYKCLREILLALEYIHRNGMVHLDIKPENIFLKNDQHKLGDFGLVSEISYHKDVEEGDSRYMSMELLSGEHDDLTKSDIFSLGITLYEVCLGGAKQLPTNGPEWQALRSGTFHLPASNGGHTPTDAAAPVGIQNPNTIADAGINSTVNSGNERDLHRIIRQMMNPIVSQRPTANELLKRPQLLSDEQKALMAEKNKVLQANLALVAQQQKVHQMNLTPRRRPLVRSNTWTGG